MEPYWNYRDELAVEDGLILKGTRLIIPKILQQEVLQQLHYGHLGMEKCKLRARSAVFWHGINKHIEDFVSTCSTCQKHRPSQSKEKFIPHEVPPCAWHTIATDLFTWGQSSYLLVADPYSRFPVVRRLLSTTSSAVIAHLKAIFEEYGIPSEVHSDNGPQYTSSDFRKFSAKYGFVHVTSSPRYAQSNGFIERMVQTVEALFDKAKESGADPHLALLNYRATPLDGKTPSPAELIFNRPIRTTLVNKPQVPSPETREQFLRRKEIMVEQGPTKQLPPLNVDQSVRIQDPITRKWTPGKVTEILPQPRSYKVDTSAGPLRRNRRHIRATHEKFERLEMDPPIENASEVHDSTMPQQLQPLPKSPQKAQEMIPLRRSQRTSHPPERLTYNDKGNNNT